MAVPRASAVAAAILVIGLLSTGCGSESTSAARDGEGSAVVDFPLPFGIERVPDSIPLGRPAVYEHVVFEFNGEPVSARTLRVAYRLSGDDPVATFQRWVDELDRLVLDRIVVESGRSRHDPWLRATGVSDYSADGPGGDNADIELWVTGAEPILLLRIDHVSDAGPRPASVIDEKDDRPPPDSVVDDGPRSAGDVLFVEQGDEMHLPEATRALMPTIPTMGGTGGSTSVLAADDGEAAVHALVDEAMSHTDYGELTLPPTRSSLRGVQTVTANFVIPAGGWGFHAVAVRGPADPYATVYVVTYAD